MFNMLLHAAAESSTPRAALVLFYQSTRSVLHAGGTAKLYTLWYWYCIDNL